MTQQPDFCDECGGTGIDRHDNICNRCAGFGSVDEAVEPDDEEDDDDE